MNEFNQVANIKVFGIGGGGSNAVNRMVADGVKGVTFYIANTDVQVMKNSDCENKIVLGRETTKGLGAGGNPEVGRKAAEETENEIREAIKGSDMVFLTAGLGGGTGTGAAPLFAKVAKEEGALTIGIVTKPFTFEGRKRERNAMSGLSELQKYTDSLIIQDTIPGNDEFMRVLTCFSGKDKKVKMMCLGHVLLEEHTPHGSGNHAVIITEPQEELMTKVKNLLETIGYVGFSNFDIKYDVRDNRYKFFEINTRQGRSNYYVTGSGFNVARYFVEEFVYNKEIPFEIAKEEHLWMVVPKAVARKYVHQPENKEKLNRLIREGKVVNPVFMKGDFNFNRWLRMVKNHFSHFRKFKTYYH